MEEVIKEVAEIIKETFMGFHQEEKHFYLENDRGEEQNGPGLGWFEQCNGGTKYPIEQLDEVINKIAKDHVEEMVNNKRSYMLSLYACPDNQLVEIDYPDKWDIDEPAIEHLNKFADFVPMSSPNWACFIGWD